MLVRDLSEISQSIDDVQCSPSLPEVPLHSDAYIPLLVAEMPFFLQVQVDISTEGSFLEL